MTIELTANVSHVTMLFTVAYPFALIPYTYEPVVVQNYSVCWRIRFDGKVIRPFSRRILRSLYPKDIY
jgi:hypothetical protein